MRLVLLPVMLLASCSPDAAPSASATGSFAAAGRDRLCIADGPNGVRAGLIVYGAGDANCSAAGRLEPAAGGWVLVPQGEGECRIPLVGGGDRFVVGAVPEACAYYCGPSAGFKGQVFQRSAGGQAVTDLAGDPLC